jgi:hypothetical protein
VPDRRSAPSSTEGQISRIVQKQPVRRVLCMVAEAVTNNIFPCVEIMGWAASGLDGPQQIELDSGGWSGQ